MLNTHSAVSCICMCPTLVRVMSLTQPNNNLCPSWTQRLNHTTWQQTTPFFLDRKCCDTSVVRMFPLDGIFIIIHYIKALE